MWVDEYKPKKLSEVVGQREAVEKIQRWFIKWKSGSEPLLLFGPPGSGKTCTVEALAKENNFDLIEMNASDVRSSTQIEQVIGKSTMQQSLFKRGKIFLLDEIEGVYGREDFGGVKEVIEIIEKSPHRIILTSNKPYDQKLRSLRSHVEMVEFKKVSVWDIEKRLKSIAEKEDISLDKTASHVISKLSSGDLRAAINDFENVSHGRKEINMKEIEILGYREREDNIFETIRNIFKSKSALAAKLAINNSDKDPDEIFWWIENNVANEFEDPEEIANAFDALSKADIFKKRITSNQNWTLKSYMIDMMTAGVSVSKKDVYRKFTRYQYPANIMILGRTKQLRAAKKEILQKLSNELHCSNEKIRNEYLPFIKIALKNPKFRKSFMNSLQITSEGIKDLVS